VFIEAKDDGGGGDNWSYKSRNSSQIITTNKPISSLLQAGCPSCRPTNSVKALKGRQDIFDFKKTNKKQTNKILHNNSVFNQKTVSKDPSKELNKLNEICKFLNQLT